jgi:predicted HTH transcriptional regulator
MSEIERDIFGKKDIQVPQMKYNPVVFKGEYYIYILYRRIQNSAAALFLITQSLSDTEILKMSMREKGLDMVTQFVSFISNQKSDNEYLRMSLASVLELSSLITVAQVSGLISEMNGALLQREMRKIEDGMYQIITTSTEKILIDPQLFTDTDLQARQFEQIRSQRITEQRTIKKPVSVPSKPVEIRPQVRPMQQVRPQDGGARKSERRDVILKLLAEKSNLSVKDFSTVITDYSEKTIQRELLALVDEGIVKKQGERRWSTYSLAR